MFVPVSLKWIRSLLKCWLSLGQALQKTTRSPCLPRLLMYVLIFAILSMMIGSVPLGGMRPRVMVDSGQTSSSVRTRRSYSRTTWWGGRVAASLPPHWIITWEGWYSGVKMFITDFWICGNSSPGYVYTVASTPRSTKRLPTPLTSDVPITTASGTAGFATAFATAFAIGYIIEAHTMQTIDTRPW